MRNPYFIRAEKNLYYVLSEESCRNDIPESIQKVTLIIMHLHYLDSLERYLKYLDVIPPKIQVFVVSSIEELLNRAKRYSELKNISNVKLVKKKNRGRDISAFLVSCREEILNYKYMCFVHDKKATQEYLKNDTDFWIDNLWNNTLVSAEYIYNIIDIFENDKEIGLLVPPEPIGEHMPQCFGDTWGNDYENTKELAARLRLKCCMNFGIPVITFGTAFWCRTDALMKLFQEKWKYEDFEDEPLPSDGTLSHAVERILSFVAQDMGYYTGTIMCTSYANCLNYFLQNNMRKAIDVLIYYTNYTVDPIYDIYDMNVMSKKIEMIQSYCRKNRAVYLYGAGKIGKRCLKLLRSYGYEPKGFIVSENQSVEDVDGLRVISLVQMDNIKDIGIIITVAEKYHEEIINNLNEIGFDNYISYVRTLR